ncbi:hypothetical protein [Williamsia maris]|uniref:Uncharacterized protein n=1 Tax=Williamsia maris TaxID=72806 RepID=A0ABT1HJ25_9NOCA|nr:hypothetical protein [Williamsia maris]MCP2177927.1 hypothetical protein [Williamsia maris]
MTTDLAGATTQAVPWGAFGAYFFLASGVYLLSEGLAKGLVGLSSRMTVISKSIEVGTKVSSGAWFVFWAWTWLDDSTSHGNGGPGSFVLLQVVFIAVASALFGLVSTAMTKFRLESPDQPPRSTQIRFRDPNPDRGNGIESREPACRHSPHRSG